ncbi:MAG: hypothetical protein P4L99_24240 [Chthoniobacter sp.]|nr:hypothetical protein [Chthoniobacter sp.]
MKSFLPFALALSVLAFSVRAEDAKPLLNNPGKVISAPDLKQPLGAEWSVAKGKWEPADGILSVTDIPDQKHIPVLHLATGPTPLIWECEFKFNNGKSFLVGCDAQKHVGRVVIGPKSLKIAEDTAAPSKTIQETAVDLKPDAWHTLRVEYAGDQIAARLDGQDLKGQHEYLATPKVRWWFAAADSVQIRNIKVTEGVPLAPAPAAK